MNKLLFLIMVLLVPHSIYPGQNLTLHINNGKYMVTLVNNSTFFENGKKKIVASPGNYTIKTTYNCTPGYKYLLVKNITNGNITTYKFKVNTPNYKYFLSVVDRLTSKNKVLVSKIYSLNETLSKLKEKLMKLEKENEKLYSENKNLSSKVENLEEKINLLNIKNNKLKQDLESKNKTVNNLLNKLDRTLKLANYMKLGAVFFFSTLVGSYIAIAWRRWNR